MYKLGKVKMPATHPVHRMSSIVYLKNKSTGKIYAYLNESVWNSTLKKCECKRKCLGYLDPVTGDIIPNKGAKSKAPSATISSYGLPFLLRGISDGCGLTEAIQEAYPSHWKLILTCCFYLLDTDSAVLSKIMRWSNDNDTPYGRTVTIEDLIDLLSHIDEGNMSQFFRLWRDKMDADDFYMSHTQSISSYDFGSDTIHFNDLPAVTITQSTGLSITYSSRTGIPVTYSVWNRVPVDGTDLRKRSDKTAWLDLGKVAHILDRGYCNDRNIDELFASGTRFIIRSPPEFFFAKDSIERVKERIMAMDNLRIVNGEQLFVMSFLNYWKGKRCYTHIYFSANESEKEFSNFLSLIDDCHRELENDVRVESHEIYYKKYFIIRDTAEGRTIEENGEAIMSYNDVAGYFVLISNTFRSPVSALNMYIQKDKVQKNFENLRNAQDSPALKLYSDNEYNGRLFLHFLALILKLHIKREIRMNALIKDMSVSDILYEMRNIRKVHVPGQDAPIFTKISNMQAGIMRTFGMNPVDISSNVHRKPE